MNKGSPLRSNGPLVSVHGLAFTSVEFVDIACSGYRLLSKAYETNKKIGVQEFLEQTNAIRFGEWRQHPSQCRRLVKSILNSIMILQAIVGDERDLPIALNQKRVSAEWRREQRSQLMEFAKLRTIERADLPEDEIEQIVPKLLAEDKRTTSDSPNNGWEENLINDLPM